jgi:2-hydroxychromene-2-carboxylate isomerase
VPGIDIDWRYFSLEQINQRAGEGVLVWSNPEGYDSPGLPAFAVAEAARRQNNPEAWEKLHYALLDTRHTGKKEVLTREVTERLADEAGFDMDRLRIDLNDATILDRLVEQHAEAVAEGVFGTPTLFFENGASGFLKMMPPPTGDQAVRAWERVRGLLAEESTIAEIKRPRKPKTA